MAASAPWGGGGGPNESASSPVARGDEDTPPCGSVTTWREYIARSKASEKRGGARRLAIGMIAFVLLMRQERPLVIARDTGMFSDLVVDCT